MRLVPHTLALTLIWAGVLIAASAPAPVWLADLDAALARSRETSLPLFAAALSPESFDAFSNDLDDFPSFARAASECVLVHVEASSDSLKKVFRLESAFVALVALPSGKPELVYSELPSAAAVVNDLLAVRARVYLNSAAQSASAGSDPQAIAFLQKALLLEPPYPEMTAARTALAEASERGRAKIAAADNSIAKRQYVQARQSLEKIAADYAGTDAALAASHRLFDMLKNPAVLDGLKLAGQDIAARQLFDQAKAAEAAEHLMEAATFYRKIIKDYPGTPTARDASPNYERIRAQADAEEKAYQDKMERECRSWMALADNYAAAGYLEKALDYYQRIIDAYPKTGFADIAREKMKKIR